MKTSISHVEKHLACEIGKRAKVFFDSVYALATVNEKVLREEEKAFWTRYRKILAAHERAESDEEALRSKPCPEQQTTGADMLANRALSAVN